MPNGWLDPANYGPHSRQHLGHTFRYRLARGFLEAGDTVLDAACGCGYGARIMADACRKVQALDVDALALARARERYDAANIEWHEMDLDVFQDWQEVDVAVSFETIEHLHEPQRFVRTLQRIARRLIVLSAPVVPTVGVNPHHKHDFTPSSILSLVLKEPWTLYEKVHQGPYLVVVAYRR